MTEQKVVIADDEIPARNLLKEYLQDYPSLKVIAECKNGVEALSVVNVLQPDIIFLDVQMPGKTGFEVLQEMEHIPKIIFSTAFDNYALKAFEVNAVDYLLKPYTRERFGTAVRKVLSNDRDMMKNLQLLSENLQKNLYPDRILVELGSKLVSISVSDIQWVEAERDYAKIHTAQQHYLSNKGIGELEQKLDPRIFVRIHRSHIIALNAISEVHKEPTGPQILLKDGTILKVSRSYTEVLRRFIY
ncbi:LytR/AlgR family response regulator transcription factor [Flavitalea antarctica]